MKVIILEEFTIYNTATGKIRLSGDGPVGIGALQPLQAGEALTLQPSDPNRDRVDTSGGEPFIVPNPDYQP